MMEQKSNDNNHRMQRLIDFLDKSPDDCFLLHALALEQIKINALQDAKFTFEKVLQINPNYVGSYYHLGKLLEQLENLTDAQAIYEKGISIAQQERDFHAMNELRGALELLLDSDD
jgi:tetratricopeptide (TPR) repeat protein